ncbi:S-adenosyl-L-methionine-dependent methyltransferase [Trema orientale]|uniref:S-adenosyl-L-methionine-dependent methyltransferase n=1 Tax=Trema orientale TaxID=63057 RepID=A0A2P5C5M6_TREOI|nr:S-adenosyl-L-methionine-dependent methyltransferase [Trema orientale]
MNSLFSPSSLYPSPSPYHRQLQPQNIRSNRSNRRRYQLRCPLPLPHPSLSRNSLHIIIPRSSSSVGEDIYPNEGSIPAIEFEDITEKDWSFLDPDDLVSDQDYGHKLNRIIASGQIESGSRVVVSAGAEGFVDRLVDSSSPCSLLLVVHDSLFVLAGIKEKYDKVKCWQGELLYVPEKWAPLDVVFLYFLPALPFGLDQVFGVLAKHCSPGARLVISHPQGREVLEQQRKKYPDVIISDLPKKSVLQKAASDHSFDLVEFVDDSGFYLAVLKFSSARD